MASTNNANGSGATPVVRCAIYTRKSTDEGLKQDFNSLDAQRDAGNSYIRNQAGEGWTLLPEQYDDGGYTGANMDRPGLRRLLSDVQAKKVDCVMAYKVDRLSRSIRDFGEIMEILEKHGATFVSVIQQFNTTTSLGRLTLNILLPFAQFERETISERTRDNKILARKRGKWTGGHPIRKCHIYTLLANPLYVVRIRAADEMVNAAHPPIVDANTFDLVQQKIKGNTPNPGSEHRTRLEALLGGFLYCCGSAMTPSYSSSKSRPYRYYVCQRTMPRKGQGCVTRAVPAPVTVP